MTLFSRKEIQNGLTGEQAADVIEWRHAHLNKEPRENGWPDKVSLGQAAISAARDDLFPEPGGRADIPLLSAEEMVEGLKYIDNKPVQPPTPPVAPKPPVAPRSYSDALQKKIEQYVDKNGCSYDEARRRLGLYP